jgi:hypothetical protein
MTSEEPAPLSLPPMQPRHPRLVATSPQPSASPRSGTQRLVGPLQPTLPRSPKGREAPPSPGFYPSVASVGPQADSARQSAPAFSFGSSTRETAAKLFVSPLHSVHAGAGCASEQLAPPPEASSSIGEQASSVRPTAARCVFSRATRDASSHGEYCDDRFTFAALTCIVLAHSLHLRPPLQVAVLGADAWRAVPAAVRVGETSPSCAS